MKIEETNLELEENAPEIDYSASKSNAVVSNQELIEKFDRKQAQVALNKTIVPWIKVALLGAVVQLVLGVTWGFALNVDITTVPVLGPVARYAGDLQAVMYVVMLPIAYKILKRWAVDVPFVIATFSMVFLYGVYRLGAALPVTARLENYITGADAADFSLQLSNPYIMIVIFILMGVGIFLGATRATNTIRYKAVSFAALLVIVFMPYIIDLIW